jgi:hypothetical protein
MTMKWTLYAFGVAPAILFAAACGDYARTNPLDPGYPLALELVGPDTIYSLNDTIHFQLVTEPARPDLTFTWTTSDAQRLAPIEAAPGSFASMANGVVRIGAEFGAHRVEREIIVAQRPIALRIQAPPTRELTSLGEILTVSAAAVDARNTPVPGSAADLQWSSAAPAVAEVAAGRVTARANGSTWIRASSLGHSDSIEVRVRQRPASLQFGQQRYDLRWPGDWVRPAVNVRDARGNALVEPQPVQLRTSRPSFVVEAGGLVRAQTYGSAEIIAQLGELEARSAVRVTGGSRPAINRVSAAFTSVDGGASRNFLLVEIDASDPDQDLDRGAVTAFNRRPLTGLAHGEMTMEQGQPSYLAWQGFANVASADSVFVQIWDAAGNNISRGSLTFTSHPAAGAPQITLHGAARAPASISADITATAPGRLLDNVYLFGFDARGEPVLSTRWRVHGHSSLTETVRLHGDPLVVAAIVRIGVLVTDSAGNLSTLRTADLASGGAASLSAPTASRAVATEAVHARGNR